MKRATCNMIIVFLYHNTLTENDLTTKWSQLPLVIQKRINKHKRLTNRLNSLAGYLLLQQALKEQNLELKQLKFSTVGKPYLDTSKVSFSISHNANWIGVCLMNTAGKIGIDIQAFKTFEPIESVFAFFSTVEQQAILSSKHPQQTLIHYWSKKEALIKAEGGQMFEEVNYTDTTQSHYKWKNTTFYWTMISSSFDGVIWIASDQVNQKIIQKNVLFL